MKRIINSPEAMIELGLEIAKQDNSHVLLYWDLGAGKTHFVKWYAHGLWIEKHEVTSPTYAYSNIYGEHMLHCDFYRLEEKQELYAKGLLDTIDEYKKVLIERPRWEEEYADEEWLSITITKVSDGVREVEIKGY